MKLHNSILANVVAVSCGAAALAVVAQTTPAATSVPKAAVAGAKSVVPEMVPLEAAFVGWVRANRAEEPLRAPITVTVAPFPMQASRAAPVGPSFQPQPVILGVPELPLVGSGASQTSTAWGSTFNYQGLNASLVVLDAPGAIREFRPLAAPVRAGDRFKIRLLATFDAYAVVDQVGGDLWAPQRLGQFYPQAGSAVQMRAGETIELPLNRNEYFVMSSEPTDRLAVSVRHINSAANNRSTQPLYRQDVAGASNFQQLVPRNGLPAMEFLTGAQ